MLLNIYETLEPQRCPTLILMREKYYNSNIAPMKNWTIWYFQYRCKITRLIIFNSSIKKFISKLIKCFYIFFSDWATMKHSAILNQDETIEPEWAPFFCYKTSNWNKEKSRLLEGLRGGLWLEEAIIGGCLHWCGHTQWRKGSKFSGANGVTIRGIGSEEKLPENRK